MAPRDMWTYRDASFGGEITGFDVEAADGSIGKVDEATADSGSAFVVVDTGPWIFGKKVMLPAGVIESVDLDGQRVFVGRTKDEIKNAPEFDETRVAEPGYREELGSYYSSSGARRFDERL